MRRRTSILIVDDRAAVRSDLRTLFELADGIDVIGEAADGDDAIRQAGELHPDVVLLDLEMPGLDAFEAIRDITSLGLARTVVVLTVHGDRLAREKSIKAGSGAFFVKGVDFAVLLNAIKALASDSYPNSVVEAG